MTDVIAITKLLRAATETAELAARALEAANNGDQRSARAYLNNARRHYDQSRAAWDAETDDR